MRSSLFLIVLIGTLLGCSDEKGKVDKHPARGSFDESTQPKKIASKPCSKYNLKFYEGDIRQFDESMIRLGTAKSDAEIEINGHKITILGFEGQAEEYINYSLYRGVSHSKKDEVTGSILMTKTETQIIICFRKDAIAVRQLVENVRARGDLEKTQYFTKQWLWKIAEKE